MCSSKPISPNKRTLRKRPISGERTESVERTENGESVETTEDNDGIDYFKIEDYVLTNLNSLIHLIYDLINKDPPPKKKKENYLKNYIN